MTPIETAKKEVRSGEAKCERRTTAVPGTYAVELTCSSMPMPLALVYYRWIEPDCLEWLWIWSHPGIRRCGLMKAIESWTIRFHGEELHQIRTAAATVGSQAYLESAGYRETDHGWHLDLESRCQDPRESAPYLLGELPKAGKLFPAEKGPNQERSMPHIPPDC